MAIPTEMSLTGYIATDPQLKYISENVARFYARIRVDYPRVNDDGTVSNRGPTYHDLIAFQTTAEHAYARFRRGDAFVASGSVTEYTLEHDGEPVHYEGFVARHVGHDATRTRYTVDRSPEHQQDRSSDRQMAVSTERTLEL